MKKNIFYAFIMSMAMLLAGCGSNDIIDYTLNDIDTNSVYSVEAGKLNKTNTSFDLTLPVTKSIDTDVLVELSNFDLALTGCQIATIDYAPSPLVLDGSKGSMKSLRISGTVANDCNATAYSLSADKNVSLAGASKTENAILVISTTLDEDGNPGSTIDPSTPTVDGNYSFYNIPSIPTITKADTPIYFKIQVIDSNLDYPSGMSVRFEPFDNRFGEMVNMKVTTDNNGYANFEYHSPKTLPSVNEPLSLTVLLEDENGTKLDSAEITLSFNATAVQPNDYKLLYGKSITVTNASQEDTITVNLLDSKGNGVSGKEIKASILPPLFGTLSNGIATTTDTGLATFGYKAPSDLSSVNGRSIDVDLSFTDENNNTITTTVSVSINASNTTPTSYNLTYAKSIIVTNESQEESITVNLLDSVGNGIAGKEIKASILPPAFGTLLNGVATTTDTGLATFSYKAPADIATVNGQTQNITLTFTDENGNLFTAIATIFITTSATGTYTMQVLPSESNVTVANEAKPINVYVQDSAGRPASDTEVIVDVFNPAFGTMNKYSEKTDSNGHVEFVYIAPDNIETLDGQSFDFNVSLANSSMTTKSVTIGFQKSVEVSPVADIYIAPNDITIVRAGETRTIKITTVDSRNYAVSTDLKIENPTQNGKDFGSFDASEFTTDSFGNKEILYTAPSSLSGLGERNITVVELSTGIEKTLTIHYQEPASEAVSYALDLSVDDSIAVDGTGTLGIQVHESGKPNDYISNVDVRNVTATMKFPKMLKFDNAAESVSYANQSINSFALHAEHLSGVAIIDVQATVFNGISEVTLSQEFPVVISSGEISSISMYHSSNSFIDGKYQDLYTLHAVDKYGNPVNKGTALHPTLINGIKAKGEMGDISSATPSRFTDVTADYSSVIDTNQTGGDRLIVIPSTGKTSKFYMGDWSILNHTTSSLTLEEQFDGVDTSGLTYVVGNESRTVTINGKEVISLADISSPNDNFLTDTQGNMQFVVSYDPALKGKTFYLAANGPSGDKRIGTALKSSFFYGGYQLRALINEITLTTPGDSFFTDYYVLDSVGNTYNGQFNALIDNFDASKGSFTIDNGAQRLTYSAPSDPDEFNALVGTSYEFNLTISETDETFETIRVHYEDQIDYTNYKIETSESNFTISRPNEQHTLEYYLSDGEKPVVGQEIRVGFIDPLKGSFENYTAITDDSGKATFTYIAPSDLSLLYGTPLTINAFFSNQSSISVDATAVFSIDSLGYILTNANDITVNYATESKEIAVQVTKNGAPVAGESVTAKSIPAAFGRIENATVITGTDGYARFNYIAADTLTDGTQPLELVHTDANGAEVSTTVNITVAEQAESLEFNLTNETNPVIITYGNQVETISVLVVDKSGVGIGGKVVSLTSPLYGVLSTSQATSNAAGLVEFSYTAPSDITGLSDINLTLILEENGITTTKGIEIRFEPAPIGSSEYNLTNQSTPVNIGVAREIREISVQLIKDGTPQIGETVTAKSIPSAFGSIQNVNVITGNDGYARFTYIAADTLTNGIQTLEVYYDDNTSGERINAFIDINVTEKPTEVAQINIITDAIDGNLTTNNAIVTLKINVFKSGAPYSQGVVKVSLPPEAIGNKTTPGVDIGHFESYEVPINEGVAEFKYIGPNNLQGLINAGYSNSTFEFYHSENNIDSDKKLFTMIYSPDLGDTYIPVNYSLLVSSVDGNMTMGIEEEKTFSVSIVDDQNDNISADSNISVTITSKNILVGKILDNGTEEASVTVTDKNPLNFNVRTFTKSGLLPVEIVVTFTTVNGETKTFNETINIVVFSGPPTALSISYVGVEQDTDAAEFIEKFAITAVDKYNNRVNTGPNIALGGMSGYAPDGSSSNRITTPDGGIFPRLTSDFMYHGATKNGGEMNPQGANTADFIAIDGNAFQYINTNLPNEKNDYLATFGLGYVYEALGKWDITPDGNSSILHMEDDYYGSLRRGLYYAMGHNFRDDPCSTDGREWVGRAESETYQLNDQGTVIAKFRYTYYLTGKDVLMWVNLTGYQADTNTTVRIGETIKHTLRGNGLYAVPEEGFKIPGLGAVIYPIFDIRISDTTEAYKNGNFGGKIQVSGDGCTARVIRTSNDYDARYCYKYAEIDLDNNATTDNNISTLAPVFDSDGSGQAWIQVEASCTGTDGGVVTYEDVLVSDEF